MAATQAFRSLSQALYGVTPGLSSLASALWPSGTALTGFYGVPIAQQSRFYNFLAQNMYGASGAGLVNLVTVLFPEGSDSTGIYAASSAALDRLYNFLAQGLYSTQAGITNLVTRLYAEAPIPNVASTVAAGEGQPGIQEKTIVSAQSVYTVTAGCANGAFLTGGTYEVVCSSSTTPALGETALTPAQLQDLASSIVSLSSATILSGKTIVSGGSYTAASARVSVTAVGSSAQGIDYYGGLIAYMCQKSSGTCTADADPTKGCCCRWYCKL